MLAVSVWQDLVISFDTINTTNLFSTFSVVTAQIFKTWFVKTSKTNSLIAEACKADLKMCKILFWPKSKILPTCWRNVFDGVLAYFAACVQFDPQKIQQIFCKVWNKIVSRKFLWNNYGGIMQAEN